MGFPGLVRSPKYQVSWERAREQKRESAREKMRDGGREESDIRMRCEDNYGVATMSTLPRFSGLLERERVREREKVKEREKETGRKREREREDSAVSERASDMVISLSLCKWRCIVFKIKAVSFKGHRNTGTVNLRFLVRWGVLETL